MTLVALAAAWLGSIAMIATWGAPWWLPATTVASLTPAAARRWLPINWQLVLLLAVASAIGGWRFERWDTRPEPDLVAFSGQDVVLEGTVAGLPDPGRTVTRYRVDVDHIETGTILQPVDGAVLITVGQYAEYDRGTRVRLSGTLDEAPQLDDFDYRAFLLRKGIAATMFYPEVEVTAEGPASLQRGIDAARLNLATALEQALPAPEAALAAGITLGRDGGIRSEDYESYRQAGLAHLIAVSGSNLGILAAMVFAVLVPLVGRNLALAPATVILTAYMLLAGADPPVIRAWIMASILLTGAWLGRQEAGLAALGCAAMVMTAVAPGAARDVGFQLSLAATAGLITFGPWMRLAVVAVVRRCRLDSVIPVFAEQVMAMSLAATLATLPVTWVNFREVSFVGPLANVLVEPLFVLGFALSLVTALAGVLWEPAGWIVGIVAYYPLAGCSWLARHLAAPEAASVSLPRIHAGWAFGAYVVLGIAGWAAYRYPAPGRERAPLRGAQVVVRRAALAAGSGGLATIVLFTSLLPLRGPGVLELAVLDVGQGDSLLLTTPGGKHILVDGGPSGVETAGEVSSQLPHWQRGLHAVVLTHPQQDHLGGLPEVLKRYDVAAVYETGATNSTEGFTAYRRQAGAWRSLATGDSFEIDGVRFKVLWPDEGYAPNGLNNGSLVIRVEYGATRILLTGDVESAAQTVLLERGDLQADILKVPHHGSGTSSEAFLDGVNPGIAVISVGEGNPFGHPREAVLQALAGADVYRTDIHGSVIIQSDGARITVLPERR